MNGETLEVHDAGGLVVVTFPVNGDPYWVELAPQEAVSFAEHVAKAAIIANAGQSSLEITARKFDIFNILTRATHMVMSLRRQNSSDGVIAKAVVEYVMREVV